jgi:hypothetical protein
MDQLGRKIGKESLAKRALFSLLFAVVVAITGAAAIFLDFFFAAMAGEAAIAAIMIPNTIFFIVLIPCYAPHLGGCTRPQAIMAAQAVRTRIRENAQAFVLAVDSAPHPRAIAAEAVMPAKKQRNRRLDASVRRRFRSTTPHAEGARLK